MRIVVIGGGLAAATAVEELRTLGFEGAIDLVTAEPHRPYQRPPLSKGYLAGSEGLDAVYVHPEGWEAEHDIALHVGTPATRISDHAVELQDGTTLPFDRLLVATGVSPRPLPIPGADAPGVHLFRTLDDSEALHKELAEGGKRVVFIGSGWIGLELAAAARTFGNDVTVVSLDKIPLAAALGDEMGQMFQRMHEEHGVAFLLERQVAAIETGPDGHVTGVRTDRETVPADLVVIGIGTVIDTSLAETAGIATDHGILVDERMQTSVPGIFAAGDVANPVHPVLGQRLRTEHWGTAIATGKVAASAMLDGDAVHDDI
ncbi:MAG: NAD(P)/FAD-dependent oxidoreductase, partial [Microbacterium sp.]